MRGLEIRLSNPLQPNHYSLKTERLLPPNPPHEQTNGGFGGSFLNYENLNKTESIFAVWYHTNKLTSNRPRFLTINSVIRISNLPKTELLASRRIRVTVCCQYIMENKIPTYKAMMLQNDQNKLFTNIVFAVCMVQV